MTAPPLVGRRGGGPALVAHPACPAAPTPNTDRLRRLSSAYVALRARPTRRVSAHTTWSATERQPQRRASRFCRVSSGVPPSDGARPSLRRTKAATPRVLPRSVVVARRDRTRRVRLRLAPTRALVGREWRSHRRAETDSDPPRRRTSFVGARSGSTASSDTGGRGGSTRYVERYCTEEKPSLEGTAGIAVVLSERKPE